MGLRAFLVATEKGFSVMPGGLTRVAPDASGRFISMQRDSSSKDTWIPSVAPVKDVSLLLSGIQNVELRRRPDRFHYHRGSQPPRRRRQQAGRSL